MSLTCAARTVDIVADHTIAVQVTNHRTQFSLATEHMTASQLAVVTHCPTMCLTCAPRTVDMIADHTIAVQVINNRTQLSLATEHMTTSQLAVVAIV